MDIPEKPASSPNSDSSPSNPLLPAQAVDGLSSKPNNIWINQEEETEYEVLVHAKFEKIPMKDFGTEVRAFRDVENFRGRTLLVLDQDKYNLHEILQEMPQKIKDSQTDDEKFTVAEAMAAIFSYEPAQILTKTIYGTTRNENGADFDQSWICVLCELPAVSRRHVVISRLENPANLGANSQDIKFVILVVAPTKEESTKTALETGRTFCTIFSDLEFRYQLQGASTEDEFRSHLRERTRELIREQSQPENRKSHLFLQESPFEGDDKQKERCPFGSGMIQDLKRRLPHYWSDFKDGIIGNKTPQKLASTTLFLYFACVLPNIAFGMLNDNNTDGAIGVKKILFSQCAGGVIFALFGGQPLIVLLTTAPLALYTKSSSC